MKLNSVDTQTLKASSLHGGSLADLFDIVALIHLQEVMKSNQPSVDCVHVGY
jgi:hypothetical protein